MSEPVFTVPLSALASIFQPEDDWHWWWTCRLGALHEDATWHDSESAARAAAITHLAGVHGIHAAEDGAAEAKLRKQIGAWAERIDTHEDHGHPKLADNRLLQVICEMWEVAEGTEESHNG